MADPDRYLSGVLADFARGLPEYNSVKEVLQALGDFCTELLPVDGVGVLLVEDGELVVATANTEDGRAIEDLEVELAEGPCTDALWSGEQVLVTDLEDTRDRYPRFVPRATDVGVHAIHALPMRGRGEVIGALDVMNRQPNALSDEEVGAAQMLADVAVAYILAVRLHLASSELAGQLQSALDSRVPIEQAKGVLAERHGESLDAAFERLRSHARSKQSKLRDVATEVTSGRLRL